MSFLKVFSSKKFTNKEILTVGFVLAVLSMISMAISVILLPMFGLWMNMHGVRQLDFFFTAFIFIFLLASQSLVLFGFPMYYAQDQKSHMTSLRILLSTLMWMVAFMIFMGAIFVQFEKPAAVPVQDFDPSQMDGNTQLDTGIPVDPSSSELPSQ